MESDRVKDAIVRAAKATAQRSRELGEELGKERDDDTGAA
jgi:hypothetical protein